MQRESTQESKSTSRNFGLLDGRRSDGDVEEPVSLLEYWKILKRRPYWFALPTLGIILAVAVYALNIPAKYRSEATILIEDQEIPQDIVGATITTYASQQIQLVRQRLFTARNITDLVEKFDIYESTDPEEPIPTPILVEQFREDMELEMVSAEVLGPRGQLVETAVAFKLAFSSPDPGLSQQVVQELVSLFLSENQRSSSSRAAGVSGLLRSAVDAANQELLVADAELTAFKVEYEGALPEMRQLNRDVIDRAKQQLSDVSLRLGDFEQRRLQLSVQLSSLSPSAPVTLPSGEIVMGDRERLQALLVDYRRKSATYQAGHPDLVRLEREIETLRKTVGGPETNALLQEQLRYERDRLKVLRERYSDSHPDIRNSKAAIAELESQLAASEPRESAYGGVADNPAYILVDTQLQSVDLEINSLLQRRRELQAIIAEHEALTKQTPQIEIQYDALLRTYENARTKHGDLQARLRAADVAADVEQGITGQRFTVIEPPSLPTIAEPRNRASIGVLGLLLAFGVGAGCIMLAEIMDDSIRSPKVLARVTGAPPLAIIPYLDNSVDIAHARNQRILLSMVFFAGAALFLAYVISFL